MATAIMLAALSPALEALSTSSHSASIQSSETELRFQLQEKLESVLAEGYARLDREALSLGGPATVSAVYSDAVGAPNRRRVYLSRYDADNADGDGDPFTGVDVGLVWVRVDVERTRYVLETLVTCHE